jgi:hypothetical protein
MKDFPMSKSNPLRCALHRSFASIRRGDRVAAERWLGVAERVGSMQRALKLMAKADAEDQTPNKVAS